MDTYQLYLLSIWYKNNITNNGFISSYSDFINDAHTILNNAGRQDFKESYVSKITSSLYELHEHLDINYLTQQEFDIISRLGLKSVILNNPAMTLNDLAFKDNDLTSFASLLNEHKRSLEIAGKYFFQ